MKNSHMLEIVQNLIEYVLTNTKFDKPYTRKLLSEMGWTDEDIRFFDADWMFREEYNTILQQYLGLAGNMDPAKAERIAEDVAEMTEAWYVNHEECTLSYLLGYLHGLDECDSYCDIKSDEYVERIRKQNSFDEFINWMKGEIANG